MALLTVGVSKNQCLCKQGMSSLCQAYFTGLQGIFACTCMHVYSMLQCILRLHSLSRNTALALLCSALALLAENGDRMQDFGIRQSHEIGR